MRRPYMESANRAAPLEPDTAKRQPSKYARLPFRRFSSRFTGKLYDAVLLAGEFLQFFPRRL